MAVKIGSTVGYFSLNVWIMANVIQQGTQRFCKRFLTYREDPQGRQTDQMVQAARTITANIAEGMSRHQTSIETEMRLIDVARASASELFSDYLSLIMYQGQAAWPKSNPEATAINNTNLDAPHYSDDLAHDVSVHILNQLAKFSRWLNDGDEISAANCLLILTKRVQQMLDKILARKLEVFKEEGGFAENMTQERLEAIKQKAITENAPQCPVCGKPMLRRVAKRGGNHGHEFWSCPDWPKCNGTRNI